jgi:hypothetical protein
MGTVMEECASEAKYDVDNASEVQGVIKPGAGLMTIMKTAKEDIKNLTKRVWW